MIKYLSLALIVIAILTILVWAVSQFIQPILPPSINSGLVLIIAVFLGILGVLAQLNEVIELFQKFCKSPNFDQKPNHESYTISGPIQLTYGNTTNITVNVTYIADWNIDNKNLPSQVLRQQKSYKSNVFILNEAPPILNYFVGRQAEISSLKKELLGESKETRLIAIVGQGGVGKTSLATLVANDSDILKNFHDGILWANLQESPDLNTILARWINLLAPNFPLAALPETSILLSFLSALLQTKNILVILDGTECLQDSQIIISALSNILGTKCKLLITSRLINLPTNHIILTLDLLPNNDAVLLLAKEIGREFTSEEMAIASEIAFLSGYHPLSLILVGRLIKSEQISLSSCRRILRDIIVEGKLVNIDRVREISMTRSLEYIYSKIADEEKACLTALSIVDDTFPIEVSLVSKLCNVGIAKATKLLNSLTKLALLVEKDQDHYAFSHMMILEFMRKKYFGLDLAEQKRMRMVYESYNIVNNK